jgi:hypothetical protein
MLPAVGLDAVGDPVRGLDIVGGRGPRRTLEEVRRSAPVEATGVCLVSFARLGGF